MAEIVVGPLLPSPPQNPTEMLDNLRRVYGQLTDLEDAKDDAVLELLRRNTGIDLIEFNQRHRENKAASGVFGEVEVTAVDLLLTSRTASGADLPPGVGFDGRPYSATGPTAEELAARGKQKKPQTVTMLPMWNADP